MARLLMLITMTGLFLATVFGVIIYPKKAVAYTYPHGVYTANTETCGQCHSLHKGRGQRILKGNTPENTCFLCHDGTQSNYNAKKGVYFNGVNEVDSPGGGFDPSFGYTSSHLVGQKNRIPGGTTAIFLLSCTSCHNPHGTPNYRNIQRTVNGISNMTVTSMVYGPGRAVTTASGREIVSYQSGIIPFCSACHTAYKNYNTAANAQEVVQFRHRVDVPMVGGVSVTYPNPGLYTTLPTQGQPTGVNIATYSRSASGSLSGTYRYAITALNAVGESVYGNAYEVVVPSDSRVSLTWDTITNATGYRIYRGPSVGTFAYLAEVKDNVYTYTDSGIATITERVPPTTTTAKIICLTCHYAHGTKVNDVMTGYSYLRRIDGMGVCQNCHKR